MNSFSILRTNVGLTTNVKIVIDSDYNMSLDSINSNTILNSDKFKNFRFNKDHSYDDLLPKFYDGLPTDLAFDVKNSDDITYMSDDFSNQYDSLYDYGATSIANNKEYDERYEYFAPLYINPDKIPKNFIVMRVDGSGINSINKNNFKSEIINKLKTVKIFDLEDSNFGNWLNDNFKENKDFPISPLDINFNDVEFSQWNGIDYRSGGYTSKSSFIGDFIKREKELFEFDKFIFNKFKENEIVFPNILNVSFLFDDTPSNDSIDRKWSLNRYFGFYLDDMILSKTISPYKPKELIDGFVINEDNTITHPDNEIPFKDGWDEEDFYYIEHKGKYYNVNRISETRGEEVSETEEVGYYDEKYKDVLFYKYKIISDLSLYQKENEVNKNYGYINNEGVLFNDDGFFEINNFEESDVWVIEIDGIYHNIIKDGDKLRINSDYSFDFKNNYIEYTKSSVKNTIRFNLKSNEKPKCFNIFKLNFTDIKDFDTKIVDTDYSKYEYEKESEITDTDEPKMYLEDLTSDSNPKPLDDFIYNNKVVNIPVSSEYTANFETFKISNGNLSDIWKTNPVYCRWGYQGSNSFQDKPYLLNNSTIFEDYNKSPNTKVIDVNRSDRNLDYFYTINPTYNSYTNHSLHINKNKEDGNLDRDAIFDFDKYLNNDVNYFDEFFDTYIMFNNSKDKYNVSKFSYINKGDDIIPNISVFKGVKFKVYDVNSLILGKGNVIDSVNVSCSNNFQDYKLSILTTSDNSDIEWDIIKPWKIGEKFYRGDRVIFDDILYVAKENTITENPVSSLVVNGTKNTLKSAPYTNSSWNIYNNYGIFWVPNINYNDNKNTPSKHSDIVYNNGIYYQCINENSNIDFWNPYRSVDVVNLYNKDDIVLYKGRYYKSNIDFNTKTPSVKRDRISTTRPPVSMLYKPWEIIKEPSDTKWKPIKIWNPSKQYKSSSDNPLVVHNEIVYSNLNSSYIEVGEEPGISTSWERVYGLKPDKEYVYKPNDNPIIEMNNRYYLLEKNENSNTLDNGINIYINKKYKNILINIYINDNTMQSIRNNDRDNLYKDIYSNLTINNFIKSINDLEGNNGFINKIKYTIIDDKVNEYSYENNIENLPIIISAEEPDEFSINSNLLKKKYLNDYVKPKNKLIGGKIDDIDKLNWYNDIPMSYKIEVGELKNKQFKKYHKNVNINNFSLYRFNGTYSPIFYEIQLFKKGQNGNFIFDTSLKDFGIIKERKFKKVNRKGSILKLRDDKEFKSTYPMIDEFGQNWSDFMIFKSDWDDSYYIETVLNNKLNKKEKYPFTKVPSGIGQPSQIKIDNNKKYRL